LEIETVWNAVVKIPTCICVVVTELNTDARTQNENVYGEVDTVVTVWESGPLPEVSRNWNDDDPPAGFVSVTVAPLLLLYVQFVVPPLVANDSLQQSRFTAVPSTSSPLGARVVGSWSKRGCLLPMIHVVNVPLPDDDAMLQTSACVVGS
jgi:hypothetical protein